jgi:hypothetical protein
MARPDKKQRSVHASIGGRKSIAVTFERVRRAAQAF